MSLLFMDGFESGDWSLWDVSTFGGMGTGIPGMSGTYCASYNGGVYAHKYFTSKSEIYISIRCRYTYSNDCQIISFLDTNHDQICSIVRGGSGNDRHILVKRGDMNGTLIDTGSAIINENTTNRIEVYYKPLNSGGVVQVKINGGSLDISFSGDSTNALENVAGIHLTAAGGQCYFDDIFVDDADWVGNWRIQALFPTAAGTTTQWDPSTGNNYACVDEKPASDTDYVSTNVVDEIDIYTMADLTGTITAIKAVQVAARAKYEGAPTPTNLQCVVRVNGTNYFGSTLAVPSDYMPALCHIWELNPDDTAAWEEADVNGMEAGIKSIT